MKLRVGACALMLVLAGCNGESPESGMAGMRGVAASKATGNLPTSLPLARAIGASIANAPDRGALLSYPNKATPTKQEGAYTWFPTAISEAHAFKGIAAGEMTVPSPDGSQVKLRYERHVEEIDGNWTWIGRVVGGDQMQEAIITFGESAVFGSIPQANGKPALSLQTRNGTVFAVQTDPSKVVSATKGHVDVMIPEAASLRSSMAAAVSQSAQVSQSATAVALAAPASSANTVDVAIGYTPEFATANGGASGAATRLVYLVQVGNQAFANSDINGYLRIVNALQVSYANTNTNQTALSELTGNNGQSSVAVPASLVPLRTARDQYGADIAVLVRKFNTPENEGCGIAWLNGADQTPITSADAAWGYAVINDGYDTGSDGKTYYCADETLVHEAAHLMGSAHDRANSTAAGPNGTTVLRYGRFPYSFGYKTPAAAGNFYTVMAYGDTGQIAHRIFSTPRRSTCGGAGNLACGVANSEDNALSLNQTVPIVAQFKLAVIPFSEKVVSQDKFGMNVDGMADLIWRNSSAQVAYWLMNGTSVITTRTVEPAVPNTYSQIGRGDLNGDGRMDILWTSGGRDIWLWSGTGTSFSTEFVANYPADWTPIAVLDVNGDGRSDIIFRNANNPKIAVWIMNGRVATQVYNFYAEVPTEYSLAGTGDFNGDGRQDLLWTSSSKRDLWMWSSNGNDYVPAFVQNYPAAWRPVGTADVNGDGRTDILWRNDSTNQVAYWLMNGSAVVTTRNASALAPPGYWIASIGDYNGDGRADIIWTSTARDLWAWIGNGTDFSASFVGNYPVGWAPEPAGP